MTSAQLERLAEIGELKAEPPGRAELEGLIHTAGRRLSRPIGEVTTGHWREPTPIGRHGGRPLRERRKTETGFRGGR